MSSNDFFEVEEELKTLLDKYKKLCAAEGLDFGDQVNELVESTP
ncbi:MAG: hypothetical protein PHX80_03625 [Candidatus Nanoarchaeia archaeon]|nr:hypothetical protein [Candidatus Nanoarchaeia archaeon]